MLDHHLAIVQTQQRPNCKQPAMEIKHAATGAVLVAQTAHKIIN
jgi:hypothetical protein